MQNKIRPQVYDQALFPEFAPEAPQAPLTQAEIDEKARTIAAAADLHEVVRVDRVSEAADDQGHTPRFGVPRPTEEDFTATGDVDTAESRFALDPEYVVIGKRYVAAIKEDLSRPDRPKFPKI